MIYQMAFGYLMYAANPFYMVLFLLSFCNIRSYIISDNRELIQSILKRFSIKTPFTKLIQEKDISFGIFYGYGYIGYLTSLREQEMYLLTTKSIYKKMLEMPINNPMPLLNITTERAWIQVYIRKGTYKNLYYSPFKMDLSHISPLCDQGPILEQIIDLYTKHQRATVFIHGQSGTGKSSIGYLLAKQLKGIYCHTFNPSEPGDQLSTLIVDMQRDDEPIVIVLEEIDVLLMSIHEQEIIKHPEIPISVYNKSTWSSFLDDMIFYKNILVIMTSNTPKETIDKIDESYLRKGRIHASYTMTQVI
jgi:hypothetical protein